jgi:hypothetical protein
MRSIPRDTAGTGSASFVLGNATSNIAIFPSGEALSADAAIYFGRSSVYRGLSLHDRQYLYGTVYLWK